VPIYQTNLWVCEVCGKHSVTTQKTDPYSDPVVVPSDGEAWEFIGKAPDEKLACPGCVATSRSGKD
jgi:hypothetical protein